MASTVLLNYVFLVSLFIFTPVSSQGLTKTADNFGPYVPKWTDYSACQGPKSKNHANFTTDLLFENNCYVAVMNFSFPANALMEDVKMEVFTVKNNKRNLLWSYRINKPCQHYAIDDILRRMFKVNECLFKKVQFNVKRLTYSKKVTSNEEGEHNFVINLTEACYQYLGNSFFYGEFTFKLNVYNKKGNIACLLFHPVFTKKT